MKVGILTFPNSVSYGATLQMVALQQTVRLLGHDAEVINYHNPYMKAEKHTKKSSQNPLKFGVQRRLRPVMHRRLYENFRNFERRQVQTFPRRPFTDRRQLSRLGERYDAVICGSDQVWNPAITDTDLSYFLDFCGESTRRVAYAPSFGKEEFSEEFCRLIQPELTRFSALSVRETPGKKLVEELTGRQASLVVDPTFLVEAGKWAEMERPHPAGASEYVLYFAVSRSDSLMKRCREFSKKHGIKMVVVGGNPLAARRNGDPLLEYAVDIGPEEWLYLMHHARYVFTNSFHGTAFSVIFKKDFYVQYPAHIGSRLRQVVEMLGLEERVVRDGADLCEKAISYDKAGIAFDRMREQSLQYLEDALK